METRDCIVGGDGALVGARAGRGELRHSRGAHRSIDGYGKSIGKFNVSVEGKRRKGKGKEKEKKDEIEGRGKERNYFL